MSNREKVTGKTPSGLNTFLKSKEKKSKTVLGFKKEYSVYVKYFDGYSIPKDKLFLAIPLADVEKAIEDITKEFEGDKFNVYNYERGFEELIQRLGIQKKERRK